MIPETAKKGSIPTAEFETFFYDDEERHALQPMLYHRHRDFTELMYVYEGTISYKIDNRMYDLKPGNLAIIDRDIWHGEETFLNADCTTMTAGLKNIRINGEKAEPVIPKNGRAVLEFAPGSAVEKLMLALKEVFEDPEADREICHYLSNVLIALVWKKLFEPPEGEEKNRTEQKNDELIRLITEYLDEHYMDNVNLKELSGRFGLSHYYLAHLFKEETGISPIKYTMHLRIGEVQNLLKNTDENIQDIGDRLGFSSSGHLSSVFKKYFGISPKQYRQMYRSGHEPKLPSWSDRVTNWQ